MGNFSKYIFTKTKVFLNNLPECALVLVSRFFSIRVIVKFSLPYEPPENHFNLNKSFKLISSAEILSILVLCKSFFHKNCHLKLLFPLTLLETQVKVATSPAMIVTGPFSSTLLAGSRSRSWLIELLMIKIISYRPPTVWVWSPLVQWCCCSQLGRSPSHPDLLDWCFQLSTCSVSAH